ncbi:DUF927 domain-containing protein (plasmid) [Azospirillum baldaniorum]|uniref:DUF927 domain-containing protein n=1 Tax=Azospirillum baldaniorum TaxID=1064539 RepID=A0A9P1K0G4_9PROT|nr:MULTISPECIES: DUF927 domain-containing protein [Azospirillum]AWJ94822.1 DUF927 domain-containing protein [Azospirillum baldaniorum]TWA69802.1 uncharacterized protein (DUF927 family) [Azospirillum brasilense]CCD03242.1 conserved protein of unknown function [Azospirillum baldaniorum]
MADARSLTTAFAPLPTTEKTMMPVRKSPSVAKLVVPVPDDAKPIIRFHKGFGKAKQVYPWYNKDGYVTFCTMRFERVGQDGKTEKAVLPVTYWETAPGTCEWRYQAPPAGRPMYNEYELFNRRGATRLICEGEKTADAAAILFPEYVATTTLGGSGAPHLSDFSAMSGCAAILAADLDEPGEKYACKVAELALQAGATEVLRLRCDKLARFIVESGVPVERDGPIPEGWDLADALAEGWTAELIGKHFPEGLIQPFSANDNRPEAAGKCADAASLPFIEAEDGLYAIRRDRNGNETLQWLCSTIRTRGLARDAESRGWTLVVEVCDPDGHWHSLQITKSALAGDGKLVIESLLDRGLSLSPESGSKRALLDYLTTVKPQDRILFADRPGWMPGRNLFVLPDRTYGQPEGESVIYRGQTAMQPTRRIIGTLDRWNELSGLAIGNSRPVLALSAAFLGPLLPLVGAEGGGFHFVGSSSIGKSTLLAMAAAVWGFDIGSWRTTDNSLEARAAAFNHLMLTLDELGELSAKVAGPTTYMLGNGVGKGRAGQTGDARPVKLWLLVFLSTGEVGIADKMLEAGGRVKAGQEVRVVDVQANVKGFGIYETVHGLNGGRELSDHIKAECRAVQGVAGDLFLSELVKNPVEVAEAVKAAAADFVRDNCPKGADGQVQRVAHRFGLAAAAGELATAFGAVHWPAGEATRGVAVCFHDWLTARGGIGASERLHAVRAILAYIERHGSSRFDEWSKVTYGGPETVTDKAHDRIGWRKRDQSGHWEYFATAAGFHEMCSGMNSEVVAAALIEKGILQPAKDGKSSALVTVPGQKKARLYHIIPPQADEVGDE